MKIENFTIFKNSFKEEGTMQPDYIVNTKEGDEFVRWGAGWIKDGKKGKFISVSKSKPYNPDESLKKEKEKVEEDLKTAFDEF